MARKSPYVIQLSNAERARLDAKARRRTSQQRDIVRSKLVLMAAKGMDNKAIAAQLGVDRKTVSRWRKRFFEERENGLRERPRSGRPAGFSPYSRGGNEGDRVRAAPTDPSTGFPPQCA